MKKYICSVLVFVMLLTGFHTGVIYAAPGVPQVTASATCTTLTLSWTPQSGATSYTVSVNGDVRTGITGTTYTYSGLKPNTSYSYAVRADSAEGSSAFSVDQIITTAQLGVPADITSSATDTTVTINWSAVPEATGYYIVRNNGEKQEVSGTTYTYTDLSPDYELGFSVCAIVRSDGTVYEGPYSPFMTVKTLPEPTYNLEFDGNHYIDLGNHPDLKPTGDLTISMWVKPGSTSNQYSDIISCHGAAGGFAIEQDGYTPNKYLFSYWNGSTWQLSKSIQLNPDVWQHVVYMSSGNIIYVFLDGQLVSTTNCVGNIQYDGTNLYLGTCSIVPGSRNFIGSLDDVAIWSRALSLQEIWSVMNHGAVTVSEGNVGRWKGIVSRNVTPPETPANIEVSSVTGTSFTITWPAVAGATSYEVRKDGNTVYNTLVPTYTFTGLLPNTTYTYEVRAKNSAGASQYSSSASITTGVATPYGNIATLLYVGIANSYVGVIPYPEYSDNDLRKLIHSSSGVGATEFVITGGNSGYGFKEYVTQEDIDSIRNKTSVVHRQYLGSTEEYALNVFVDGLTDDSVSTVYQTTSTSYTFTGLEPNTTYTYAVRAKDVKGSWYSMPGKVTTLPNSGGEEQEFPLASKNPAVPANIKCTEVTDTSFTITWDRVPGAKGYDVCLNGRYYNGVQYVYSHLSGRRTLKEFADAQLALAERIWAIDPNVKVWFSLPYIPDEGIFFAYKFNTAFKRDIIDYIRKNISREQWEHNVIGFYYGTEAVTPWYTKFDTSDTEDFSNPVVNNMIAVSSHLKKYGKKFLWIPYYRYEHDAADIPRRLFYIACTKDIFDYVDLQTGYYFHSSLSNNLKLIRECVQKNTIVDGNGIPIGVKTSNTQIGVELEIDFSYSADNTYQARYNEFFEYFSQFRGIKHISLYCGERNSLMSPENLSVYYAIKAFCTD